MERVDILIEVLNSPIKSEDEKLNSIIELGCLGAKNAIPYLINEVIEKNSISWNLKNAAAICLGDLGSNEAVPHLMKAIMDPNFQKYAGTYLYALTIGPLDCKDYFIDFIELLCTGSLEIRSSADKLIEFFLDQVDDEIKKKSLRILTAYKILQGNEKTPEEFGPLGYIEHVEQLLTSNLTNLK